MKALLLIALLATIAFANAPTFTLCGGSLKNPVVKALTDFKGGSTAKFSLTATVENEIAAGYHIYTEVKVFGDHYESKDDDLCTYAGSPFSCPITAGTHTWEFSVDLPSVPFEVPLDADSLWALPSNKDDVLLCMKMHVDVQP
jgi:hypothetical protein